MKHDLDYMMQVMQAFKEGKKIEYNYEERRSWHEIKFPNWNWDEFDYRIKPEPKPEYVPYETGAEFIQEVLKHKGWVMIQSEDGDEIGDCYYPIGSFSTYDGYCVILSEDFGTLSFDVLLRKYVWADDKTPCGKLKQ